MLYDSNENGRPEVYLRSWPDGARRHVVSADGGQYARFIAEGTALLYSKGDTVFRVLLDADTGQPGEPEVFVTGVDGEAWDALPDGSGVIAIERRQPPLLRVILDATSLFERSE